MKKVFRVLIGLALILALSVPMAAVGGGEVKADDVVYINETNFPDSVFRQYLLEHTIYSTDGSEKYYTQNQINNIVSFDLSNALSANKISSLQGIEYFTALVY